MKLDLDMTRTPYTSMFGHSKRRVRVMRDGQCNGVIKIEDVLNYKGEKVGEVCYCRTHTPIPNKVSKTFATPEDMVGYLRSINGDDRPMAGTTEVWGKHVYAMAPKRKSPRSKAKRGLSLTASQRRLKAAKAKRKPARKPVVIGRVKAKDAKKAGKAIKKFVVTGARKLKSEFSKRRAKASA